jgi:hypothetical protein
MVTSKSLRQDKDWEGKACVGLHSEYDYYLYNLLWDGGMLKYTSVVCGFVS